MEIPFTHEHGDQLCELIAMSTSSMKRLVEQLQALPGGYPSLRTVFYHLRTDADFARQFEIAKQEQGRLLADSMLELFNDDSDVEDTSVTVQKLKLKLDTSKWLASKLAPKQFGDRLDVSGTVQHEHSVSALFTQLIQQPNLLISSSRIDPEDVTPIDDDDQITPI